MKHRLLALGVAILTATACADSPTQPSAELVDGVLEAAWDYKITGNGQFTVSGEVVELSVSLTEFENRTSGQVQYDSQALNGNKFHIDVDAFHGDDATGRYEMCGVLKVQEGTGFVSGNRMGVAIENVEGGADRVRVADIACDGSNAIFPATLIAGDFKVRSDL